MRQANFNHISNKRKTEQFALAVPENILAPLVNLEPSKAVMDAQSKRGASMDLKMRTIVSSTSQSSL